MRPVTGAVKIGALGKDFLVVPKPYPIDNIGFAIPAGIYRVKYEDNDGYFLPAPTPFKGKIFNETIESAGGLYVRKKNSDVLVYFVNSRTGEFRSPHPNAAPLDKKFLAQLRQ